MSSFVLCVRDRVSGEDEFSGGFGAVSYLQIPDNENVPRPSHKTGGVKPWLDAIVREATPSGAIPGSELDIVFFVHGYNTSPEESLKRQRLVQKELLARGFNCILIGFDWPTAGSAALYVYDRFEAQKAACLLVKGGIIPSANYTLKDCPISIHLMAHSMGGFVVREAFRAVDKGRNSELANDWRIGQLILFAADISSGCFALNDTQMVPVFNHCGRLTNYFSGYDKALAVANVKNIDISSRVGRVGMPTDTPAHAKAVDVDCGPRYASVRENERKQALETDIDGMVSHSWYLGDPICYDDLALTLKGQVDRNSIPTRNRVGPNDFVLVSQAQSS